MHGWFVNRTKTWRAPPQSNQTDTEFRGVDTEFYRNDCVWRFAQLLDASHRCLALREHSWHGPDFDLSVKLRARSVELRVRLIALPPPAGTLARDAIVGNQP
jgi:hypothetical protein